MNKYNTYQVNLKALRKNCDYLRQKVGDKKICAMVKANGYGVGVKFIIATLKGKVDFYGVSCVGEAKEIRRYDTDTPILVVGKTHSSELKYCSEQDIRVSVSSFEEFLQMVKKNYPLKVHIKINTGLNRYGISRVSELKEILCYDQHLLTFEGIMTHFATKSNDVEFIHEQFNIFQCFVALMDKNCIAHCSNSYATLNLPHCHLDMVRVGYALYNTSPVVSIQSKIIEIQTLQKGETLGYDRTYLAKTTQRIGVVPIGYADGLDRRGSNRFRLWTNGRYVRVVGNICMDVCFVELGKDDKVGQEVEILGEHIGYSDYAKVLGTSNYDVMLKWRYRRMQSKIIADI